VSFTALVAAVSAGREAKPFFEAVPVGLVGRERWKALMQLSGPPIQASEALTAALRSEPADPMLAYYLRREGLRGRAAAGSLAAAILAGDRATLETSTDPWARTSMARALLQEGRVEEALVVADIARQQNPLIAESHALFAAALEAAGLEAAAGESLLLAAQLAPWDPAPREALARLHWHRDEAWKPALGPYPLPNRLAVVAAELTCRSGEAASPPEGEHARHLAAAGWCQLQDGDLDTARSSFHGALGLEPQWTPAMLGLAEVHQRRGDTEGRIAHMRAAAATSPADPRISLALTEALTELGRPAEALGVLTRLAHGRRMDRELEESIRKAALQAGEPGAWLDSWARTTKLAPSAVRGAAFLSLVALLATPLVLALGMAVRRTSPVWGLGEAAVTLGVALVGPVLAMPLLLKALPNAALSLDGPPNLDTVLLALGATVIGEALAGGFVAVLAWRTPDGWERLGFKGASARWLMHLLAAQVVVLLAGAAWALTLDATGHALTTQEVARVFDASADPLAVAVAAFLAVVCAPFLEELLFRGMLQRVLINGIGTHLGVVAAAVLFGAMHLGEPLTVPPLIVLGLAAGWLREASGSLWPAVLLHMLNNALAAAGALASG
jgi:membrane protease YdiL (CAAX protease family)/Tfp pilus assembly protein PilF